MSASAIFSLLWPKNLRVLESFVHRHPGTTILSIEGLILPEGRERIVAAGGSVVCVESLLTSEERQAIAVALEAKQQDLRAALKDPAWQKRWQTFPISPDRLGDLLSEVAAAQLPFLVPLLTAIEKAAAKYDLRLLLLNEDLTAMPRVMIAWAKRHGVPSLHLSHGVELFEPYTVHAQLHADVTAVFGERGSEGYKDIGLDTSSLRITGNPAWDDYPQLRARRSEIRAALAAEHTLTPQVPIVVFGTTWAANLTAFCDEGTYGKTLRIFLEAGKQLMQSGMALQLVIKDRPGAPKTGAEQVSRLIAELALPPCCVRYVEGEATSWVIAADVVISIQSNLSIEAMLAGVPAIDLLTETGMSLGPCFAADSGVLEVEESVLAAALGELLRKDELKKKQLDAMQRAAVLYNVGVDGKATERVVALMEERILAKKLTCD